MQRTFSAFIMNTTSTAIFFLVGIVFSRTFPTVGGQLPEEEVPQELRYILHSDMDKWEPPKELEDACPYYLSGYDDENRPIWIVEIGKWDLQGIVEKGEKWEKIFDKYMDKWLWRMWESSKPRENQEFPVKDGFLIIDFEGMNHRFLQSPKAVALFFRKMRLIVYALPFAHGCYILNANIIAKNLLNLGRPILGKDFHRVEIFGTNPNSYRPFLLKRLPRDQIPERYGGDKNFKPVKVYGR